MFESLEKKLRVSLTGLIAEAMTPLRSLIFSQAKMLEDSVSKQLEEINSRVSQVESEVMVEFRRRLDSLENICR